MSTISHINFENAIINELNIFLEKKDFSINNILSLIENSDKLNYELKYEKYDSAISAPVAKYIIDYQKSIYRLAALMIYDKPNINLLKKHEKELLEVPFYIKPGCTELLSDAKEIITNFKEIYQMTPDSTKKHLIWATVVIIIVITTGLCYHDYQSSQSLLNDNIYKTKQEVNKQKADLERYAILATTTEKAMQQIKEQNNMLYNIAINADEENLQNLQNISEGEGNSITLNGVTNFTSSEIKNIKNKRFSNSDVDEPIYTRDIVSGNFVISEINNIEHKIRIEEKDKNGKKITISYNPEDNIFLNLENTKEEISKSVRNESKIFNMKFTLIFKDGKQESAFLDYIKPIS